MIENLCLNLHQRFFFLQQMVICSETQCAESKRLWNVFSTNSEAKAYLLMLLLSKTRYLALDYAYKINERKKER